MSEFVLEHTRQLGIHYGNPSNRDAKLAIIDCACPGRCVRDVDEFLLRVQNDNDLVRGLVAKLTGQISVPVIEGAQELLLQVDGSCISLVVQDEMRALPAP